VPEGEIGGGIKPLPPAPEAPELDEGRGCSTSMEDGVTGEGTAALLVEQGTIISKSSSHRKSKEDGDGSVACKRKGKLIKHNMTRYNNATGGDVKTTISFMC
jgi:hypothetical protein